jgi:hypothetical protein
MVVWAFALFIFLIVLYWVNGFGGLVGRIIAFGSGLWLQNMVWRVVVGLQDQVVTVMAVACGSPS